MSNIALSRLPQAALIIGIALTFFVASLIPFTATAASDDPTGKITTTSSLSTKPTLRGEADDTKRVSIAVYKEGSTKAVFMKRNLKVRNDDWSVKVSKRLANGTYDVKLTSGSRKNPHTLATSTLAIGKEAIAAAEKAADAVSTVPTSSSSVTVTTIPLLMGGTARGGNSIPVSYLQLRNTGKEAVRVEGFTVTQNGTAPMNLITSLSTVDGKGESRTTSKAMPFKDGSAFVPSTAVIEAGSFKIFTIKANLAPIVYTSLGKNFKIDVTGVHTNGTEKATYPLRGTTWMVGW